ncbi:hypothetical protein [Yeosuana sp.]|uniref:hypothetical protein n=1 Tax=Yeosuana sp. TaxID=2529388 RepID=UPI004054AE1E|tara:strand:- start:77 stop:688 length:612 start_codon:yes stop_codon:yes gene_type:complete
MKYNKRLTENEWLDLLKNAIDDGVEIQVNHRFKYKNKSLGTFLTSAKRKNKIELIQKIEALGIHFKMHSKNPEHYLEKFTVQLSTDKKPNKQRYLTRFNSYVLPKKDILKKETIKKLNKVWKMKFGDIRKWEKPETTIDKIQKWKQFRYDKKKNPSEKWFDYKKNMGKLYGWVYVRKTNEQKMNLILEHFNDKELTELKQEGF